MRMTFPPEYPLAPGSCAVTERKGLNFQVSFWIFFLRTDETIFCGLPFVKRTVFQFAPLSTYHTMCGTAESFRCETLRRLPWWPCSQFLHPSVCWKKSTFQGNSHLILEQTNFEQNCTSLESYRRILLEFLASSGNPEALLSLVCVFQGSQESRILTREMFRTPSGDKSISFASGHKRRVATSDLRFSAQ